VKFVIIEQARVAIMTVIYLQQSTPKGWMAIKTSRKQAINSTVQPVIIARVRSATMTST
jgi:hypothetical protein